MKHTKHAQTPGTVLAATLRLVSAALRSRRLVVCASALLMVVTTNAALAGRTSEGGQSKPREQPVRPPAIPRYGVFEQTFRWPSAGYNNPWEQVQVTLALTSPSGKKVSIDGFYYAPDTWKARFSPGEIGAWSWKAVLTDGMKRTEEKGRFTVEKSGRPGFVRPNPANKFRWVFDNGSPYYPLGIGDCLQDANKNGVLLDDWGLDGDFRPPTPDQGQLVAIDTYLKAYRGAGVNLFRWSVDNCAFGLYRTLALEGNVYLEKEGRAGDQLVRKMGQYGLHTYMVIFGFNPPGRTNAPPPNNTDDPAPHSSGAAAPPRGGTAPQSHNPAAQHHNGAAPGQAHQGGHNGHTGHAAMPSAPPDLRAIKRYVKYVVDRYGAYVDYWELMNEASVPDEWYGEISQYLRSIDPYKHPISTSWEKPEIARIDINSPHWYQREDEFQSDTVTWNKMQGWKRFNKPVIVGEQGNQVQNYDDRSGLRMRLRSWTAFFAEGAFIFWNASFAKDYKAGAANIYLGPQERGYLKVLQNFTRGFDSRAMITDVKVSDSTRVRAYALRGPKGYAAYLHAYTNHTSPTKSIILTIKPQSAGTATWINPATGQILGTQRISAGSQNLTVPVFTTDIALKIGKKR